jgi:hypothetical protein
LTLIAIPGVELQNWETLHKQTLHLTSMEATAVIMNYPMQAVHISVVYNIQFRSFFALYQSLRNQNRFGLTMCVFHFHDSHHYLLSIAIFKVINWKL